MPERNPLVSILINNYNYGHFLDMAIESALSQSYRNTEVIVVDDGSTDSSREVISSYEDKIVPALKENGGQASAFNAGFEASKGEIVTFLDADDYLFPETVKRVVAAWKPGVASVQYRLETVDAEGRHTGYYPPQETIMQSGEVWRILLESGNYTSPVTSGLSLGREALTQLLPMPEEEWRISADGYLITLAPFYGRVVAIEEPLAAYRQHGNNLWAHRHNRHIKAGAKFCRFVQHDLQKQSLLIHKAKEMGHEVPQDLGLRHWAALQTRLICLRLNKENHPVSTDRSSGLALRGMNATFRYSRLPWKRRLKISAWFAWVGLLPSFAAKPVIAWMFDRRSSSRTA